MWTELRLALRSFFLLVLFALTAIWTGAATAQDMTPARVQYAIDLTERRIEQAEAISGPSAPGPHQSEISLARQLQSRARSLYTSGQYPLAMHATLDARGHADRCIAMLRGMPDPERVAVQIERTRDGLERARESLDQCSQPRVIALLGVATEMQKRAELALAESRYLAALQATMSSRERTLKALRLCRISDSLEGAASHAIQRSEEVLSRAREAVAVSRDPLASQALARAESGQEQASTEFRAGRFEVALRLTQAARVAANRAVHLAQRRADGGQR